MVVCGQEFTPELLDRISAVLAQEPGLSRRALSRRVCEWLNWRGQDGRLKQMSCRVALLRLHRRGALELPAAVSWVGGRSARGSEREAFEPIEALCCELGKLGRIEVVLVGSRYSRAHRLWGSLMSRYHYLGAGRACGAQLRYLIVSEHHGVVGALGFSSAAWRLAARDKHIGWSEAARVAHLAQVVANSRFLILPQVSVPHLASHALSVCLRRLGADWGRRYGLSPLLVESFVERARFRGSCYRAGNWHCVGQTRGRGRQDARHRCAVPVKDIYLYPLHSQWRERLCVEPALARAPAARNVPCGDWASDEFGRARLGDARLEARLISLGRDFYAKPRAQIPQACGSRAKTKAAYRFFDHDETTMDAILASHYEATVGRASAEAVVLAAQDTTSLNYNAQPAIENLGPIGTRADAWFGLLVHDTMAFTASGLPLGLIDVQCWARDASALGKKHNRKRVPIEDKESYKWLKSVQAAAHMQARLPDTTVVSVGDREADLFELFDHARALPHAPKLLIRAEQNRALVQEQSRLWEHMNARPVAGYRQLRLPRRAKRSARVAKMAIAYACVELKAPQTKARLKPITVWAVLAREIDAPTNATAIEWMLLTTCEVSSFDQATEKLAWYTQRWGIEVYHRTLKSGCQIEQRQLGAADRIQACLAIDMVVAWRILHLTREPLIYCCCERRLSA
jgi:hypothetical protein